MTPDITLHNRLTEATRRIRLLMVYRCVSRTLCWTALACLVWLAASRLNWVPEPQPGALVVLLSLAAIIGIGLGTARRLSAMDVARLTDGRLHTKDRLASALEFERAPLEDPLLRQQIADAGAHARSLDLRRAYPVKVNREAVFFVALALALFGAFYLPTLPVFWSQQKRQEIQEVKKQGVEIEKIARDTQKAAEAKKLAEAARAAKEARKLAEAMKRGSETKKTAMIKLAKLTKQVEEQHRKAAAANGPATKPMEKAAKEVTEALEKRQKEVAAAVKAEQQKQAGKKGEKGEARVGDKQNRLAKNAEADAKKRALANKQSQAMQEAQQALQKFSQALSEQNGEKQNQALQQLAQQMEKGQMSRSEMQQLQKQLQQIASALKGTDLDKASRQMQQMAQMMQQMKLDPETMKKLAQMMRQAGGT